LLTVIGLVASAAGFVGTISFAIYRIVSGAGVSGTVSAFALVFAAGRARKTEAAGDRPLPRAGARG
jgi:hypothetical protein